MTANPGRHQAAMNKKRKSPLLYPAIALSLASLAWTTWSLVDLLGTGLIGGTVAAGADVIWGSVIIAEARGLRIAHRPWIVPTFGWVTLLIVAAFLSMHGIEKDSIAMAAAGPFLPFGAKAVWVLALADMRDPAALTDDEKHTLAAMERGMTFEEAQHRIEMRRREMDAELQIVEVGTDFDIELMRQNKTRALTRRRPLELPTDDAHHDPYHASQARHANDAATTRGAVPAKRSIIRGEAQRTGTEMELADQRSDTPLMHPVPASAATQHDTDDTLQFEGVSKAAAVRAMRDAYPAESAPQISERLAYHGVEASDGYVRTVLSRIKQQQRATDGGYL